MILRLAHTKLHTVDQVGLKYIITFLLLPVIIMTAIQNSMPLDFKFLAWKLQLSITALISCSSEHLLLFNEKCLSIGLKKGPFSPEKDSDLARVMQYVRGKEPDDLQGVDVFKFLVELARDKAQTGKGRKPM